MRSAVIVFPGSNCDRDLWETLKNVTGKEPHKIWHADKELPASLDLIAIPGGFSYGDYLRSGAMAARSPIMQAVIDRAQKGVRVLGICNGFQVLTEAGLLPGVLMRNRDLKFLCKTVSLRVENNNSSFTKCYKSGQIIQVPIAHHDGNYFLEADGIKLLQDNNQVVLTYADENPNGSQKNIAGIINKTGNVLGMMPHPERVADPALGGIDGRALFESLLC
jgi:phosphoribosylformylglycinamidine synthase I